MGCVPVSDAHAVSWVWVVRSLFGLGHSNAMPCKVWRRVTGSSCGKRAKRVTPAYLIEAETDLLGHPVERKAAMVENE